MDQQRLHRVARTVALRLGVVGDADRHVGVGILVDEHVAHTVEMLEHGHGRFVRDAPDEAFSSARDQHVDVPVHGGEQSHRCPVGGGDQLHRVLRQARGRQPLLNAFGNRLIRMYRFRAAAQDAGITRFGAQRGGVRGHVRTRLVHYPHDSQRNAHAADLDSRRSVPEVADLADRIGQGDDLPKARRHRFDAGLRQRQAVDECGIVAGSARGVDIAGIGCAQLLAVALERCRGALEGGILVRRRRPREHARRRARALADVAHVRDEVEPGNVEIGHAIIVA